MRTWHTFLFGEPIYLPVLIVELTLTQDRTAASQKGDRSIWDVIWKAKVPQKDNFFYLALDY
jgi:hypothetical protein